MGSVFIACRFVLASLLLLTTLSAHARQGSDFYVHLNEIRRVAGANENAVSIGFRGNAKAEFQGYVGHGRSIELNATKPFPFAAEIIIYDGTDAAGHPRLSCNLPVNRFMVLNRQTEIRCGNLVLGYWIETY